MDRRDFLHLTGCTIMAGLLTANGCGSDNQPPADAPPASSAYPMSELIGIYTEQMPYYRATLEVAVGEDAVDTILGAALVEFTRLAPAIPYIGPLQYPLPKTLAESGVALGFGKALQARGIGTNAIGQVIVGAFWESQRGISDKQHLDDGSVQFNDEFYKIQASLAEKSHQRLYPGDWVYDFIEGTDASFDWGLDFTECGILKLFRAQGMPELMPYICVQDFFISDLQKTGLQRSGTLAAGADRCDFRYKQNRPIQVPAL